MMVDGNRILALVRGEPVGVRCETCEGRGAIEPKGTDPSFPPTCHVCNGTGRIRIEPENEVERAIVALLNEPVWEQRDDARVQCERAEQALEAERAAHRETFEHAVRIGAAHEETKRQLAEAQRQAETRFRLIPGVGLTTEELAISQLREERDTALREKAEAEDRLVRGEPCGVHQLMVDRLREQNATLMRDIQDAKDVASGTDTFAADAVNRIMAQRIQAEQRATEAEAKWAEWVVEAEKQMRRAMEAEAARDAATQAVFDTLDRNNALVAHIETLREALQALVTTLKAENCDACRRGPWSGYDAHDIAVAEQALATTPTTGVLEKVRDELIELQTYPQKAETVFGLAGCDHRADYVRCYYEGIRDAAKYALTALYAVLPGVKP